MRFGDGLPWELVGGEVNSLRFLAWGLRHPPDDAHGWQNPQNAGHEEIKQMHPGAGLGQMRYRDYGRKYRIDDDQ